MTIAEKIHASMLDYLRKLGYPNMSYEEILQQCPHMWRKLETEGLVQRGMSYKIFCAYARRQKKAQENMDAIEAWARNMGGL